MIQQSYINHIGLVLDASASMGHLEKTVIQVTDQLVKHLAQRSQELDQETRATVYTFGSHTDCAFYDKDVLRLPSINKVYRADGRSTALIDATLLAIREMEQTATLHGDHAFLIYVLTDGQENSSRSYPQALQVALKSLRDNWTVAVLVPDQSSKFEAKKHGFANDNIAIWDATTTQGVIEVGETIRRSSENFMVARSQGLRSSKNIFQLDTQALTQNNVQGSMNYLDKDMYTILDVKRETSISEFVSFYTGSYKVGKAYYQLSKRETIQPQKDILVLHRATNTVYYGHQARQILGLPNYEVKVDPHVNAEYDIFVQSTSSNRKLMPNTKLIVKK